MGRKLSTLTWADVKKEMSIAGDPDKIIQIGGDIHDLIVSRINSRSIPELENMQFALKRVLAELKLLERFQRDRQNPKIV